MVRRLIMIVFVFIPLFLSAQWEIVHQNKWGYFTSLDLVSDSLGFVTTDKGYILRTTDGGFTWEEFNKLNWALSNIQFLDEDNGWMLGRIYSDTPLLPELMRLLRTKDGGITWNTLEDYTGNFFKYQFITPEKGWAIKYNYYNDYQYDDLKFIFTVDGGESWNETDNDTTLSEVISNFQFVNENIGWAIGGKDLYKTEDGGVSWNKYNYQNDIQNVLPVSTSVCYVEFEGGNIHKTTDGGNTWNIYKADYMINPSVRIRSIKIWYAVNESSFIFIIGLFHGEGVAICKTTNGFKTNEVLYYSNFDLRSSWTPSYIELFDGVNGIALNNSYILRTSNQGDDWYVIHSVKIFKQLNFLNEHIGFLNDVDGRLYKTINSGKSWESIKFPDSINLCYSTPFNFINEDIGFVGGENCIYKTIDGGGSWKEIIVHNSNQPVWISNIYFLDDKNGWALEEFSEYIYQTTNCGESWEKVSIGFEGIFNSIDFTDESIGFIVGFNISSEYPFVAKTNNAGDSWEHVSTGTYEFKDIDQVSPTLGFAISGSTIFRSDDAWSERNNWEKQYENQDVYLKSIYMIDSLNGFVCGHFYDLEFGKYGYILKTTDGGVNWVENYSIYDNEFNDIQFIDENNGWAVGENSLVLHTTNGGLTWVEKEQATIPNEIFLNQNYPNPFNPSTTIKYSIPIDTRNEIRDVRLIIYDILGRKIKTLVSKKQKPGNYEVEFDGSDLTSGVYFYKLDVDNYQFVKKMLMIK